MRRRKHACAGLAVSRMLPAGAMLRISATYIGARAHTHTNTHTQARTHARTHARARARAHTHTPARPHAHTQCSGFPPPIYIYIYAHTHTTHTRTHTHTHTHAHAPAALWDRGERRRWPDGGWPQHLCRQRSSVPAPQTASSPPAAPRTWHTRRRIHACHMRRRKVPVINPLHAQRPLVPAQRISDTACHLRRGTQGCHIRTCPAHIGHCQRSVAVPPGAACLPAPKP
jgi:hypothetical protein